MKGLEALRQAAGNDFRSYNTTTGDNSAGARIQSNILCPVAHTPKFQLSRSNLVFTSGSCFAREVELALARLGIRLASSTEFYSYDWFDPHHTGVPGKAAGRDIAIARERSPLNRYSVHSMLYDFERVLEKKHTYDDTIVPIDADRKIWDPQLKNLIQGDQAFTLKMRDILDRSIEAVKKADVAIFTLGMTETWVDDMTGAILPVPPSPAYMRKFPDRFSFFIADYDAVVEVLKGIIAKLKQHCEKQPKIIFTVSPVPMGSTFTSKDVIVANSHSKSTLVAAAQSVAAQYDHVDYFPSYEIVKHSSHLIWYPDAIHIREDFISQIMQKFIGHYLPE